MATSIVTKVLLLTVLADGLVTRPSTGCKKVSLLHRGDPADSKTIEGDDCGNVKQINQKWAKATQVGKLAGAAKAAVMGAETAAKNTGDAVAQAKAVGEKAGLDGKIPDLVKSAAGDAEKAATAATEAASKLSSTADTFGGKFDDFAKAITDDDIIKIKKETEAAVVASEDAIEAAERALTEAAAAKKKALKNSDGALNLIKGTLESTTKLSTLVGELSQKAKHAASDVEDLIGKSKDAAGKVDKKAADSKEQKPVWEAYKADLEGREKAAEDSKNAVGDAIDDLKKEHDDMDSMAGDLKRVSEKAQSAPAHALGRSQEIDAAEAAIRETESALAALKKKVITMKKDGDRLTDKIAETNKRLK